MAEDLRSKFIRKLRRTLVKAGVVETHAAADKYIRVKGVEAAAKAAGYTQEAIPQA